MMVQLYVSFVQYFFIIILLSCTNPSLNLDNEPVLVEKDTIIFGERKAIGTLDNSKLDEISGMARSLLNKNTFWVHNDSGDEPNIYLIDSTGQYILTCHIENGINRDWEDLAVVRDPIDGQSRIYIGDIGDNNAKYKYGQIYICKEPSVINSTNMKISFDRILTYQYDDGPRDAETLMVDPLTGDIFILSKRETNVQLYQIPYPYDNADTIIAQKVLSMPYTQTVAGDISQDGSEILIKNYQKVWYWPRKSGITVAQALSKTPFETTYIQEPQGEALCWSPDGKFFYTLSEESPFKIAPVLYKFEKLK